MKRPIKNTALAKKLAAIYEAIYDEPFPGGVTNAFIGRFNPGHWQRSAGAVTWELRSISAWQGTDHKHPRCFHSQDTAKECAKDSKLILID